MSPLVGDAQLCLEALRGRAGHVPAGPDEAEARPRRHRSRRASRKVRRRSSALATSNDTPIRPERVVAELQAVLPEGCRGRRRPRHAMPVFLGLLRVSRSRAGTSSPTARTARSAIRWPASVGAYYGRPSAKVVSRDGRRQLRLHRAASWRRSSASSVPITMVVISNSVYGWIKAGQKTGFDAALLLGRFQPHRPRRASPRRSASRRSRSKDPADLRPTLAAAVEHGGPTLVDVICQPLHEARAPVSEWVA